MLSSREFEKILIENGFVLVRQKGSHKHYVGFVEGKKRRVIVIANQKDFAAGTFRSMIRQSGLQKELFENKI